MSKKELNDNEIEKVSGGNGEERKIKLTDATVPSIVYLSPTAYGGPPINKRILEKIKKEQNKDKEKSEKGKLPEE